MPEPLDEAFNLDSLPAPNIDELPKRGACRLLACGATASVLVNNNDLQRLAKATNLGEYGEIATEITKAKQIFVVRRTPIAFQIATYLEQKGVPVERLRKEAVEKDIPLEDSEYFSERLGAEDVQAALANAEGDKRVEVLEAYANTLAGIHKEDIVYGSNHLGNMILGNDKRVYFLDFKTASMVNIDWKTATTDKIYQTFSADLATLIDGNLRSAGCSEAEIKNTLNQVVQSYPITEEAKSEILKRL